MLVNSKDSCNCCPEMRCCTPETVTASVDGMSGQIVSYGVESVIVAFHESRFFECDEECEETYAFLGDSRGSYADIILAEEHLGCVIPLNVSGNILGWTYNFGDSENLAWSRQFFPPQVPYFRLGEGQGRDNVDPMCGQNFSGYFDKTNCPNPGDTCDNCPAAIITGVFVNEAKCDPDATPPGHPKFCERPEFGPFQAGPCNPNQGILCTNQEDLNGTYVCHRPNQFVRPQLKPVITRQVPLSPQRASQYPGVTEAVLLYNVAEDRQWVFLPPPYECWDILFPNDGDKFIVDYRCGKRNPWYAWEGGEICTRGRCLGLNQGVVKPHLAPYHQSLNHTAQLYLRLGPASHEPDPNGRFPDSWKVIGVDIKDGGYGYEVGEFFYVNFDNSRPPLGGERISFFPRPDTTCFPAYYPNYIDKYGYSGQNVEGGVLLYQRIRISEVAGPGSIVSLEVVPIFKTPEYKDPPLCNVEKTDAERTILYTSYGRVLCHPISVAMPGIGYSVGDQITWVCETPGCLIFQYATAIVSDVDDEGGILDWKIRGSDFPGAYASVNVCDETGGSDGNYYCVATCTQRPVNPPDQADDRGHYEWKAKVLCDLRWEAVGVPVRKVRSSVETRALCNTGENQSNFTTLALQITRRQCETAIEVYVYAWPFGDQIANSTSINDRALALWPPYPECAGGGAVITPVFGAAGANESDWGSAIVGGVVRAGGAGYTFRDKYHVPPTLPLNIPAIGGGSGAAFAAFQFGAVHNFPNPGMAWGSSPPTAYRFSYFPVTGATISAGGSGYQVGQEFEVKPDGGRAVTDMWKATGGDSPDVCPNGAWYDGPRATGINAYGYFSLLVNQETGQYGEPVSSPHPVCVFRISSVNASGGITGLEVVHRGMMFKTVFSIAKKNPDANVILTSTLGYGAMATGTFSESGALLSVSITADPSITVDPKHPGISTAGVGVPDANGGWIEAPSSMPFGGRDYADQSAGYFWMLENTYVGGPVLDQQWFLQAHLGWHGHAPGQPAAEPLVPRNFNHETFSTHNVFSGEMPSFVPRSSVCAFSDCYHSLLNKTYPLVKVWGAGCFFGAGAPFDYAFPDSPSNRDAQPTTGYALLERKNPERTPAGIPYSYEYTVIEYGPTLSLSAETPASCPDHANGTPYRR
jgi:hypothetical protein